MMDQVKMLQQLETLLSEVLSWVSATPKILPAKELNEKAKILVTVRRVKELLDGAKSDTNKALDVISEQLCREMVNLEMLQLDVGFDDSLYRLYPKARGFYSTPSVCAPEFNDFYDWVRSNPEFINDVNKRGPKRALDALCDGLLEAGRPLPPHVKAYVRPTITVRRLERHDKGRQEQSADEEVANRDSEF
jgi:hypothetical protein